MEEALAKTIVICMTVAVSVAIVALSVIDSNGAMRRYDESVEACRMRWVSDYVHTSGVIYDIAYEQFISNCLKER